MTYYKDIATNEISLLLPYQQEAYQMYLRTISSLSRENQFGLSSLNNSYHYNKNGYDFTLQKSLKFPNVASLKRQNGTISGIVGPYESLNSIECQSTQTGVGSVELSCVMFDGDPYNDRHLYVETANMNYIIEYAGATVEILKGEKIWRKRDNNKIAIGWHGSYSPPHGM